MSGTLLFDIWLPFIILKEGFTMRKKFFFKNIGYVVGFGFFGTILFICIWTPIIMYLNGWISGVLDNMNIRNSYDWSFSNVIHIVVILVSTDTIAPLALIDGEKYPNLFAVVFGEGVCNDAVSLIAFNTVFVFKFEK